MSKKGTRVLQEYLDDLLSDDASLGSGEPETAVPSPISAELATNPMPAQRPSFPMPAPARQPASRPLLIERDTATEELAALEQIKRERLQALLNSKPLTAPPAPEVQVETPAPLAQQVVETPANLTDTIEPHAETETSPDIAPVTQQELAQPLDLDVAEVEPATEAASAVVNFLEWHENGRPQWGQKRFEALLFTVSGLTLAVPLIALGQIQPLTDELTPIFGQADWFMGLLPTPAGKLRTVNTARLVMPEKYDPSFVETAKYVVSIDGLPWALAVDDIAQPISIDPDDVKWRSERSKRPWLAGTVKSAMCALIDIPQMGKMLNDADRNMPSNT